MPTSRTHAVAVLLMTISAACLFSSVVNVAGVFTGEFPDSRLGSAVLTAWGVWYAGRAALRRAPSGRFLVLPSVMFALVVTVIGSGARNYLEVTAGVALLIHAGAIWMLTSRSAGFK